MPHYIIAHTGLCDDASKWWGLRYVAFLYVILHHIASKYRFMWKVIYLKTDFYLVWSIALTDGFDGILVSINTPLIYLVRRDYTPKLVQELKVSVQTYSCLWAMCPKCSCKEKT